MENLQYEENVISNETNYDNFFNNNNNNNNFDNHLKKKSSEFREDDISKLIIL